MTRLRSISQSLSSEARERSKKHKGVHVVILVYDAQDTALAYVHDDQATNWDGVANRLKGTAEEIRTQLRSPR
jgi:hypothetical protein